MKYVLAVACILCALFNVMQAIAKDATKFDKIAFNVLAMLYVLFACYFYVFLSGGLICL